MPCHAIITNYFHTVIISEVGGLLQVWSVSTREGFRMGPQKARESLLQRQTHILSTNNITAMSGVPSRTRSVRKPADPGTGSRYDRASVAESNESNPTWPSVERKERSSQSPSR